MSRTIKGLFCFERLRNCFDFAFTNAWTLKGCSLISFDFYNLCIYWVAGCNKLASNIFLACLGFSGLQRSHFYFFPLISPNRQNSLHAAVPAKQKMADKVNNGAESESWTGIFPPERNRECWTCQELCFHLVLPPPAFLFMISSDHTI